MKDEDKALCIEGLFQGLFQEASEAKCREWSSFVEDFQNNNVCLEKEEEELIVRNFLKVKGHGLLRSIRSRHAFQRQNFDILDKKIRDWNNYRNQVNLDLDHHEVNLEESKVINEEVMGVYSKELQSLIDRIAATRFSRKPKGPIGSCFSVVGEWKPLVEYILRPVLFTFLVHNQSDRVVLDGLIDECYGEGAAGWPADSSQRPAVWITTFDAPRLEVETYSSRDASLVTVMDAVRIHGVDKVVTRFLIDYTNLHRILLFNTQHDAFPILSEKKSLPPKCMGAYTMDFFKVSPYPSFKSVQLNPDELTFDLPPTPYHNGFTNSLSRSKLRMYRKSAEELQALIRSMKDMQLDLWAKILQRKDHIQRLQRALKYMHKLTSKELAVTLDLYLNNAPQLSQIA